MINFYTTYLAALLTTSGPGMALTRNILRQTTSSFPSPNSCKVAFWKSSFQRRIRLRAKIQQNFYGLCTFSKETVIVSNKQKAGQTVKLSPQLALLDHQF